MLCISSLAWPVSRRRSSIETPELASAETKLCRRLWNDRREKDRPLDPELTRATPASTPAFSMIRLKAIDKPLLPPPLFLARDGNRKDLGFIRGFQTQQMFFQFRMDRHTDELPGFSSRLNAIKRFSRSTLPHLKLQTSFNLAPARVSIHCSSQDATLG